MERMLAIVFDDETKAYEGSRALNQLDAEGSIALTMNTTNTTIQTATRCSQATSTPCFAG
jgi:hypothetical protein